MSLKDNVQAIWRELVFRGKKFNAFIYSDAEHKSPLRIQTVLEYASEKGMSRVELTGRLGSARTHQIDLPFIDPAIILEDGEKVFTRYRIASEDADSYVSEFVSQSMAKGFDFNIRKGFVESVRGYDYWMKRALEKKGSWLVGELQAKYLVGETNF